MSELVTMSIPALLRGVAGWAENAFEDGKISVPEWQLLGATILRVGIISSSLYFGWDFFSDEQADALATGFTAVLIDIFLVKLKKKK